MNICKPFGLRCILGFMGCFTLLLGSFGVWSQAAPLPSGALPSLPPSQFSLPQIKGAISWDALAKVKTVKIKNRFTTEFPAEVNSLNKREVKVVGFMMPLAPGEKQTHFLLSYSPQTCSFCLPAGPEGMVEVKAKTPIKVSFEPLVVSGKFSVLVDDPAGVYYRLTEAVLSQP